MAENPLERWLLASVVTHGVAFALLLAVPNARSVPTNTRSVSAMELAFEPAPRPVAPPPPVPAPVPPPVASPPLPPAPAARVTRPAVRVATPEPVPAPTPPPPPPPVPAVSGRSLLTATPAPPPFRATDLLRESHASVTVPTAPTAGAPSTDREPMFTGSTGSELDRARAASQGYVQGVLTASSHREAPGVRGYLWGVRRRVAEVWRPGVARVPNLADTLLAGFLAPDRAIRTAAERFMQRQRQVLAEPAPRLEGAADAIEAIGGVAGNGPTGRQNIPTNTTEESWRRNSRTTRAEVQVEQDATGRVTDVRLVRSSGLATFDNAALDAVRHGVAEEDPIPLPGGRRSRWSFTVTATRRLIAPNIGGSFDESRGWFQVQLPGQVLLRSRVQLESSAPLDAPSPASP